jgi:hypothetical protein
MLRSPDLSRCAEGIYALVCENGHQRITRTISVAR